MRSPAAEPDSMRHDEVAERWPIEIACAGRANSAARKTSQRYDCLQLGLTWPREILVERIERRLRERLDDGMIDEVAGLRARGVSDFRLEKLGLEYRYIARYLRGELGTLDDLRTQLVIAIRQFAKEQLTWFKRDSRILWLDPFKDYFVEACRRIRAREEDGRHVPIVAMTASALKGDRERCLEAGMDDYLPKPVRVNDLRTTVQRWIA